MLDLFSVIRENIDILTLLGLLATNILMLVQNRIAKQTGNSQNLLDVVSFLQAEDTRAARRHVLVKLKKKKRKDWVYNDYRLADRVCASYDILGRLVRNKYVGSEIFLDDWGNSIRRCYLVLAEHIKVRRKQAGRRQWDDFEWLYKQVVKWETEHSAD